MKMRYDSLFGGFSNEMRKFFCNEEVNVTVEQLKLLITNEPLNEDILREIANNMVVKIEVRNLEVTDPGYVSGDRMTEEEQARRVNEMKGYLTNIITRPRDGVSLEEHYEFVKKLLRFWTGRNYYIKNIKYRVFYKYGVGINISNLPEAHTCHYSLEIYGFPDKLTIERGEGLSPIERDLTHEEKEKYIYDKLIWAVGELEMVLQ
jgi:hypothetical protein